MKNKKNIPIIILLLILAALILVFVNMNTYKEYSRSYFYMDTYISVKINTVKSKNEVDRIFDDIDYLYDTYHKLTDKYNSYDGMVNVYYLNEILDNGEEIKLDKRLSDIIDLGIDYYDKTDGLFNIASGNLTGVWKRFIDNCDILPSDDELDVNINIDDISLDSDIYYKKNDIRLDLGGLAKGYVTELVGKYLEDNNINSYVINAGGNVKVGKAYNKDKFVIGIADPDNVNDIFVKVNINNLSVVTSGNYQRYCLLDDVNYNHIINPITKYPGEYMKSVTVISSDSTISDIYSTYLFLLPVEEGLEIVNNNSDIEAIWYIDQDNIIRSDGFDYE